MVLLVLLCLKLPSLQMIVMYKTYILESLDIAKASGPDKIPTRILKLCASEIAPILTVIFIQSLNSGQIPKDWLTANINLSF